MRKISLLLFGCLAAASAFAYEPPKGATGIAVVRTEDARFKLFYKAEEKADVRVQIFNEQGRIVFSEVIRQSNGFSRPYSFANLKEGDYRIRVDNGANWLSETVSYFSVPAQPAQVVRLAPEKYLLTVAEQPGEEIFIRISDAGGQELYNKRQRVEGDFAKVFNLNGAQGPFLFEVSGSRGTRLFAK